MTNNINPENMVCEVCDTVMEPVKRVGLFMKYSCPQCNSLEDGPEEGPPTLEFVEEYLLDLSPKCVRCGSILVAQMKGDAMTEKLYAVSWEDLCGVDCACYSERFNTCAHVDIAYRGQKPPSEKTCPRLKRLRVLERVDDIIGINTFVDGIGLGTVDVNENEHVYKLKPRGRKS